MTITTLLDPTQMPSPDDDQIPFDNKLAAVFRALPQFGAEVNATAANMNSIAYGGAYAIPFTFSDAGSVMGGGGGGIAVQNYNAQTSTSTIVISTTDARGSLPRPILDDMYYSVVNANTYSKGDVKLTKQGDASRWISFRITSWSFGGTYGTLSVVVTGYSSANPFALGDPIIASFQRTGDKGDTGATGAPGANGFSNMVVLTSTQSWTVPAGTTKLDVIVVDGGASGTGTTGITGGMGAGGKGGNGGRSIVAVTPGTACTATIGAGGASSANGTNAGGTTSFAGSGFTTITSANATLKIPGGNSGFFANNTSPGNGGGTMVAPPASTGYGVGGKGGNQGAGDPGQAGVVIIRY